MLEIIWSRRRSFSLKKTLFLDMERDHYFRSFRNFCTKVCPTFFASSPEIRKLFQPSWLIQLAWCMVKVKIDLKKMQAWFHKAQFIASKILLGVLWNGITYFELWIWSYTKLSCCSEKDIKCQFFCVNKWHLSTFIYK